jgi:hypothetical protein
MQESSGNVRAPTTFSGEEFAGGLMQRNGDTGFPLTDQNGDIINHTMTSDDIN